MRESPSRYRGYSSRENYNNYKGYNQCRDYNNYKDYESHQDYNNYGSYGEAYAKPPFYQKIAAKAGNIGSEKKAAVKCDNIEYKTTELLGNYLDIETGECITDFELFQMFIE